MEVYGSAKSVPTLGTYSYILEILIWWSMFIFILFFSLSGVFMEFNHVVTFKRIWSKHNKFINEINILQSK